MSNEYLEYIKKHRLDFVKLTDKQDAQLARLYIQVAGNIKAQATSILDKEGLTYAAAKIRVNSLLIEADRLSDGFKGILNQGLIDASNLGMEADKIMMSKYQSSLADNGIKTDMMRILQKVNPEAVKAVFNRIYTDGLKLSDRVWLLDRRTKQEIERIVLQNVISGGSASNKATLSALENLLNPNSKVAKLTSLHGRKVGYESSRLLRTSMSEAFNEGARLSNLKNPGSTGMKLLNASGPCEVCAALDLLPVEQTGLPPIHPNCRCTTLEDVQSVEDFTDRYIKFMDDPSSDKQLGDWVLNVYGKGGEKTLTAVKDVTQTRGHLPEQSKDKAINTIINDAKNKGIDLSQKEADKLYKAVDYWVNQDSSGIKAFQTNKLSYFEPQAGIRSDLEACKQASVGVEKFIEISPAYTKNETIFRGVSNGKDIYQNLPKSTIIDLKGTSSFTTDMKRASERFSDKEKGLIWDFAGGTDKSASIQYLSPMAQEQEIILSKDVIYKFTGEKYIDTKGYLHMVLEESL